MNRYQKAAKIVNDRSRKQAIENYYKKPSKCKECGCVIEVKENQKCSEVRKKIFCSKSCSNTHNNRLRPKKEPVKKEINVKPEKYSYFEGVTKKQFFDKKGIYYLYRAAIRRHAHFIFNSLGGDKMCRVCGYDKHVEVCHIKSVSSFNDDDLITDINSFDNLVGLCPNHHWEFDNGHIKI